MFDGKLIHIKFFCASVFVLFVSLKLKYKLINKIKKIFDNDLTIFKR